MDVDLTPILLVLLGGGGLVGGIIAWRKLPQERTAITVEAGEGVIVMQDTLIKNLRAELDRATERITALEQERGTRFEIERRVDELEHEKRQWVIERDGMRERIGLLEREVSELRKGGTA